jgi:hypothetical protein
MTEIWTFNFGSTIFKSQEMATEQFLTKTKLIVIGYGNTLRRDDGVGPKVAEAVADSR